MLLKYLILVTLALSPLLVEVDVFAIHSTSTVSISSNNNNYEEGETIQLTVSVSQHDGGSPTLKVEMLINGILVAVDKMIISENGEYTFEFLAEGPFFDEEGIMTARAFLRESTDTTQFNYKPRPVEDSKQIIEKSIIVIENSTTITEIVRIALGSEILGCDNTNSCFVPNKITIEKGSQIKWVNEDSTHTITGGTPNDGFSGTFDSGLITEDFVMNFDKSGIYPYYCTIHPWMQGLIIVETDTNNSPKVEPEVILSKPITTPSVSKGTISLSPPKDNPELVISKDDVSLSQPKVNLKPVVPKPSVVISSKDKPTLSNLDIFTVIAFFALIFLGIVLLAIMVHRKFKKRTKNYNYEEEKNSKEYQWNKKRSEDHHRQQEEERQRWEREKYNRQQNKQKQEKQHTASNKTEFSVAEALDILNINQNATAEMIKKAQREMVLKYHPDKHKSIIQRNHAEMMMKNINIAYETLQRANRV